MVTLYHNTIVKLPHPYLKRGIDSIHCKQATRAYATVFDMSFGYGIGDVIAGAALIQQLIGLLDESTGAGAHYRRLKIELQSLQDTLTQVQFLDLEDSQLESRIGLEQTASLCKETVEDFISLVERKIRKYDSGLGKKQPIWKLKSTFRKIQWNTYDFDRYRKC